MERQGLAIFAVGAVVMALLHEAMQLREIGTAMHSQFFEGADDYYSVLGLRDTCTRQEIDTAYKRATSRFNSKNKDEDERRRRAKIVTAYETLSKESSRKAYDKRRRLVYYVSAGIQCMLISVPALGIILLSWKFLRAAAARIISALGLGFGGTFEEKLNRIFKPMYWSVEITVQRSDSTEKLGMDLNPPINLPDGAIGIKIGGVASGGVVDKCNQAVRANQDSDSHRLFWWSCQEIQVDDVITCVNGQLKFDEIRNELQSASTLCFSVRRSIQQLFPWVNEVELTRDTGSERWGCQLTPPSDGSDSLEVSSDEFTGALKRWNDMNPSLCVRKGDRVVAVDRQLKVGKFAKRMQDQKALSSNWLIVRGVSALSCPPQEVTSGPFEKQGPTDKLGIRIGPALDRPVRGHIIEPGAPLGGTVVKEIHANYLVDEWNRRGCGPKVVEGAVVLSVNGKHDPKDFASELKKRKVVLCFQSQRGTQLVRQLGRQASGMNSVCEEASKTAMPATSPNGSVAESTNALSPTAQARLLPLRLDLEQPIPLVLRLLARFLPSLLGARSFEIRLRCCLARLRCEFDVELERGEGDKLGLNLHVARDDVGGFSISEVGDESLIGKYNAALTGRALRVQVRDRLVMVNGKSVIREMQAELENRTVSSLCLRFSRSAADASPGVWEADVERSSNESSWGMQLKEQTPPNGGPGSGVLRIDGISPGSAVDRWNKTGGNEDSKWVAEPGDLIVGVASEVGYASSIAKLKESQSVRLTILRWHAGAALRAYAEDPGTWSFEVILNKRSKVDKLGIKLDPSEWDPTRTVIAEIYEDGLVDRHNKAKGGSNGSKKRFREARIGDEVESINGESDQGRFAQCCQADRIVLRLARRGPKELEDNSDNEAEPIAPVVQPSIRAETEKSHQTPLPAEAEHKVAMPKPTSSVSASPVAKASAGPQVPESIAEAKAPDVPEVAALVQTVASGSPYVVPKVVASPKLTEPIPEAKASLRPVPHASASKQSVESTSQPASSIAAGDAPEVSQSSQAAAKTAQEAFLLKTEVDQLKRQLSSQKDLREERDRLQTECERVRAENAALQEEAERQRKQVASSMQLREALAAAQAELASLREEQTAVRSRLQESLRCNDDLASTNSRLLDENEKLKSAKTASAHAQVPIRVPQNRTTVQDLDRIGESMMRLQELSASLEHVLSCNPETSANGVR